MNKPDERKTKAEASQNRLVIVSVANVRRAQRAIVFHAVKTCLSDLRELLATLRA